MTELDLDAIEARATDIANLMRVEPVVILSHATHARVSLLTSDVRELVAEVRRLRAALTGRQTMAAVYGYELAHAEMPDHDQRVRRDAAADALAHAADLIGRHHGNQHGLRISEHIDQWAAEVRAGTRTIPESTGIAGDPPTSGE